MSAQPAPSRHLHLVNEDGEVVPSSKLEELQEQLEKLKVDLKMAQRDVKAKNRRIAELEANKIAERLNYERRGDVERILKYWWRKCRNANPRVQYMSPDRFDLIRELLDSEETIIEQIPGKKRAVKRREPRNRLEDFKAAIDGAHFDGYSKPRKNGSVVTYDDITTICKSQASFDEHIKKAPGRKPTTCTCCGQVADHEVRVPDVARDEVNASLRRA